MKVLKFAFLSELVLEFMTAVVRNTISLDPDCSVESSRQREHNSPVY